MKWQINKGGGIHIKADRHINNIWIWLIILLSLLMRICFIKNPSWDISSCILMGKYIYSFGKVGLWESLRPILYPAVLGLFWKLGGEPIVWENVLEILFGLGSIYATYLICKTIFDKRTAILSAFFLAFSSTCLIWNDPRIPSTFFGLISIYSILKNKSFPSGILIAIAFLIHFSQIFLFIYLFVAIILLPPFFPFKKQRFIKLRRFVFGFTLIIVPFLISNAIMYKNSLCSFIIYFKAVAAYSYNWYIEPFYYIKYLIAWESPCLIFYIIAIIFIIKRKHYLNGNILIILIVSFLSFIFITIFHTQQLRYLISVVPYLYIISSYGITETYDYLNKKILPLSLLLCIPIVFYLYFGYTNIKNADLQPVKLDIFQRYIQKNESNLKGNIWISNPTMLVYSNLKAAELMYYPIFDINKARELRCSLNSADVILFLSTDFPCAHPDNNNECAQEKKQLIEDIISKFDVEVYLVNEHNKFVGGVFKHRPYSKQIKDTSN